MALHQEVPRTERSSSDSEPPLAQTNPMLMTQKTIQINWTSKGRNRSELAQGFDFDRITDESGTNGSEAGRDDDARRHSASLPSEEADDVEDAASPPSLNDDVQAFEAPASEHDSNGDDDVRADSEDDEPPSLHSHRAPADAGGRLEADASSPYDVVDAMKSHDTSVSSVRSSVKNRNGNNNGGVSSTCTSSEQCTPRSDDVSVAGSGILPNFFPPSEDLTMTMKALRLASNAAKTNTQLVRVCGTRV